MNALNRAEKTEDVYWTSGSKGERVLEELHFKLGYDATFLLDIQHDMYSVFSVAQHP